MAFFKRMSAVVGDLAGKADDMLENMAGQTPEVKTVNALAASFAVLVMADRVAEDEEKEEVSDYLIDMEYVIENNLIREISTLFMKHIATFEAAQGKSPVEFNVCIGETLQHIAAIKGDKKAVDMVAETVNLATSGGNADKDELKARDRILKALGRK